MGYVFLLFSPYFSVLFFSAFFFMQSLVKLASKFFANVKQISELSAVESADRSVFVNYRFANTLKRTQQDYVIEGGLAALFGTFWSISMQLRFQ